MCWDELEGEEEPEEERDSETGHRRRISGICVCVILLMRLTLYRFANASQHASEHRNGLAKEKADLALLVVDARQSLDLVKTGQ